MKWKWRRQEFGGGRGQTNGYKYDIITHRFPFLSSCLVPCWDHIFVYNSITSYHLSRRAIKHFNVDPASFFADISDAMRFYG